MSIATLKRKTQTKYNNMSVGLNGFSINGTHRNQGYVGQTSLSRSLPRTLMRGNTVRGHGGCCGTFIIGSIVQSGVTSVEDSTVVKTSTSGTSGMLSSRYKWDKQSGLYPSIKPDSNNHNIQSDYIKRLTKKTISDIKKANDPNNTECTNTINAVYSNCPKYDGHYKKPIFNKPTCFFTKPTSDYVPMSSGEYMIQLNDRCAADEIKYDPPTCRMPFDGFN